MGQSGSGINRSAKDNVIEKKVTLRFNFTGVIDGFDQNISFGAEYRFGGNWSAGIDFAYIFRSVYLSQNKSASGYIVRPFVRFYPDKQRTQFLEAQLHYKFISYKITDWLGRDVSNGVPAYEEYTTFDYRKRVYGINIIAGTQENLTRDKKLKMELYIGLGYRYKKQGPVEGTYSRQRNSVSGFYGPEYSTFVLPLGASLIYDLK